MKEFLANIFGKWFEQYWTILFSQFLVGKSKTFEYENGEEFANTPFTPQGEKWAASLFGAIVLHTKTNKKNP